MRACAQQRRLVPHSAKELEQALPALRIAPSISESRDERPRALDRVEAFEPETRLPHLRGQLVGVKEFADSVAQYDDITVMAVRYLASFSQPTRT